MGLVKGYFGIPSDPLAKWVKLKLLLSDLLVFLKSYNDTKKKEKWSNRSTRAAECNKFCIIKPTITTIIVD